MNRLLSPADLSISAEDRVSSRGFTIVEIMIVVALMGILAAMVGPKIGGGMRGAQTRTSVRKFAAALRAARMVSVTHRSMIVAVTELGSNRCEFRVKSISSSRPKQQSESLSAEDGSSGKHSTGDIPEFFQQPFELAGDTLFIDFRISSDNDRFPRGAVMFLPQGNSTGGEFILGPEEGPFYSVSVDAVTGRVHMDLVEGY